MLLNIFKFIINITFCILFLIWIFFLVKNKILLKRLSYSNNYIQIKENIKNDKIPRLLFKAFYILWIIIIVYTAIGMILCLSFILIIIFTFLIALAFLSNYVDLFFIYLYIFKILIYLLGYLAVIRFVYINYAIYQNLKTITKK